MMKMRIMGMSYKFDALISILNWMESGQTVTPQHIQDQLGISERTAFRYMQTLEGAGFSRMARQALFDGDVAAGREYLLVDDFIG